MLSLYFDLDIFSKQDSMLSQFSDQDIELYAKYIQSVIDRDPEFTVNGIHAIVKSIAVATDNCSVKFDIETDKYVKDINIFKFGFLEKYKNLRYPVNFPHLDGSYNIQYNYILSSEKCV